VNTLYQWVFRIAFGTNSNTKNSGMANRVNAPLPIQNYFSNSDTNSSLNFLSLESLHNNKNILKN
jgi:hypothetical protein